MLIKILAPAIAMLALIVVPLALIYRRAKAGKSVKKPLYANLVLFFVMMFACATVFLTQGVAAAGDAAASVLGSGELAKCVGYLAAALSVGISGVASAKAVSNTACAAIGALIENDGTFGKAVVFVGMAEGIAIYGMLVAIIIVLL